MKMRRSRNAKLQNVLVVPFLFICLPGSVRGFSGVFCDSLCDYAFDAFCRICESLHSDYSIGKYEET